VTWSRQRASARLRARAGQSYRFILPLILGIAWIALVTQSVSAHAAPISQTFRNGTTLSEFSGTFEVVWPLQVTTVDAVIELRDAASTPLMQMVGSEAVEAPYTCPSASTAASCSRIYLSSVPTLAPGSYSMFWRVTHADGYVEQRVVRFTVDPLWVSPTPTTMPSPSPTVSPRPTASIAASLSPSAVPATPASSPTGDVSPSLTALPTEATSPSSIEMGSQTGGPPSTLVETLAGAMFLTLLLFAVGRRLLRGRGERRW